MSGVTARITRVRLAVTGATPGPLEYDLHRPCTGFSLMTQAVHVADVMEANSRLPRGEALANAEKLLFGWNTLLALLSVAEASEALCAETRGRDTPPSLGAVDALEAALFEFREAVRP